METFGELLAYFSAKEEENVENVSPLIDDGSLRDGLVAWKSVSITFKDASSCDAVTDVEKWRWMWEQIDYNQGEYGVIAGLRTQDIGNVIQRLMGLRLIYPDGTINKMARQFLQSQIMAKLAGKRPAGRPKKDS